MNVLRALQYVLGLAFGLLVAGVVVLGLMLASPLGGMGSLPLLDGGFWLVMTAPAVLPVVIVAFVAVTVTRAVRYASENEVVTTQQAEPPPTEDGDPVEILQSQYSDGEISHAEYEQRLQVLLDTGDADEILNRLDAMEGETAAVTEERVERN